MIRERERAVGSQQGGVLTGSIFSRVPTALIEMVVLGNKVKRSSLRVKQASKRWRRQSPPAFPRLSDQPDKVRAHDGTCHPENLGSQLAPNLGTGSFLLGSKARQLVARKGGECDGLSAESTTLVVPALLAPREFWVERPSLHGCGY
jgi:hypothetical protein